MPIVTDEGFLPVDPAVALTEVDALSGDGLSGAAIAVDNDVDASSLAPHFDRIDLIVVRFPSFADGRGFSVARRLRALGYAGRLRAQGHVISDQYAMARACGFDEVQIDAEMAARQPERHWLQAANRTAAPAPHALRARPSQSDAAWVGMRYAL